ncbi:MAG: hypothetical protein IJM57_07600 [Lachnospiraceae bacterium]|nr:hypothetical protein [Lachnospiraceae bacterium]
MKSAKKITAVLICCLLAVVLSACSGTNDAKAMKTHSEAALKEMLSKYYGLQEDAYRYKVHELNEFSGPNCGVIWSVTTEKCLEGNGNDEFLIFLHGDEMWEYTNGDVFSDRYSAQFVQYLKEELERRLLLAEYFTDLSYSVLPYFSEGRYFSNYSNLLPIYVNPDNFETYLKEKYISTGGGIRIEIQVLSGESLSVTKEQLATLIERSMSDLPICSIIVSRYTDREKTRSDLYAESFTYYYSWNNTWEFEQLPSPEPKEASKSDAQ